MLLKNYNCILFNDNNKLLIRLIIGLSISILKRQFEFKREKSINDDALYEILKTQSYRFTKTN